MLFSGENSSSVFVKQISRFPGTCLTVNFRDSVTPVLWQLGLGGGQNAIITLRGKDDDWSIGLVEPKGEFTVVARFDNQEDAEAAFAEVQKTFMKGRSFWSYGLWRWVVAIVVIVGVMIIGSALTGSLSGSKSSSKTTTEQSRSSGDPEKGVPLVADDVLKSPESPFGMLSK
jgi:hypothetical protein